MDVKLFLSEFGVKVSNISEDLFSFSMSLDSESKESNLFFYASNLVSMALEIMEDKNNG